MRWSGEPVTGRGVVERGFDVECEGRRVPGLAWTPEGGARGRPLVLIGHGGTLHKRSPYILSFARRLVRRHGFAAAAIDGPAHGDRRSDGGADPVRIFEDFRKEWEREEIVDEMIADWRAALSGLEAELGSGALGYWGLSMGTIFGVPFVAAEERVQAATFGLMGTVGPTAARLAADAARVRCPVLFLQQWDDELIPRDRALALFDALAARDKRLHAHPGRHVEIPAEAMRASESFLVQRLSPAT